MEVTSSPIVSRPARPRKKPRCHTCLQTVEGHKLRHGRRVCPQKATPRTNPYPRPLQSPTPSSSSSSDPLLLSSPKWSPARSIPDEFSPEGWKPEKSNREASTPNRSHSPEMTASERMFLDRLMTPNGFDSDISDSDSDSSSTRLSPSQPRITVPRPANSQSTSISSRGNEAVPRKDNTLYVPSRELGNSPHQQHVFDMYDRVGWVPNYMHYKNLHAAGIICYQFLDPDHAFRVPTNAEDLAIHQSIMRGIVIPWVKTRNSKESTQLLKRISVMYDGDGFEADLGPGNSARYTGVRLSASDIIDYGTRCKKDEAWKGKGQWYRRCRKPQWCRRWANNGQLLGVFVDDEQEDLSRTTPYDLFTQWTKHHMTAAQRSANPDWFFTGDYPDKASARKALLAWLAEVGDERGIENFPAVLDSPPASPIVDTSPLSPVETRGGSVDSDKLEYWPPTPPPEPATSSSNSSIPPPKLPAEQLEMLRRALLSIPPQSRGSLSPGIGMPAASTSAPHSNVPRPSPAEDVENIQHPPLTPAESPSKFPSPVPEVFFTPPLIPELDGGDTIMMDIEDVQPAPSASAATPAPEPMPTETVPEPISVPAPAPAPGPKGCPTLFTLLPLLSNLTAPSPTSTQPPWCLYVHPTTPSQLNSATAEAHSLGLHTGVLVHPSSPDSEPPAPHPSQGLFHQRAAREHGSFAAVLRVRQAELVAVDDGCVFADAVSVADGVRAYAA
ncbi:hypothetical protein EVG20_g52 [Dentipellis fragilis]|uniref:Uncharacterized protein n=1 Tax=Dentipellis fragilis TaxID=205917 RepID=A0A4Y9ZGM1_9AGAM|nr:hypothetical protein EVG20_g52 [Dentipellis fragilis]